MEERPESKGYVVELQALIGSLDLTPLQRAAAEIILQRMGVGVFAAEVKGDLSATKAAATRVKYLRLDAARAEGRLEGKNTDERKLNQELVEATDQEILSAEDAIRRAQEMADETDAVYSNLYHLNQILLEAVQRETTS